MIDIFTIHRPLSPKPVSAREEIEDAEIKCEEEDQNGLDEHEEEIKFEADEDPRNDFFIPIDYDLDMGEDEVEESEGEKDEHLIISGET